MLLVKNVKMIEVSDWDELVSNTYNRPYRFQQQDGCKERGMFNITIPSKFTEDEERYMNESIPEVINGEEMGIKFKKWLERNPKKTVGDRRKNWEIELFWDRNFYPNIQTVANDLYSKGLIEAGDYIINIDW